FGSTGRAGLDQCFWIGISVGVTKHHDQKKLEEKGSFLSVFYNHSSSKAVKAGIHTGQDVGGRS
ncbi:hypothetical protein, partial [Vibrio sp. Vb2131]|uniref:hypothetical protein n=1 Tax=Vibrio sp. Vb2131 TaxID=3074649 RepID=UPI002964040F